VVDGIDGMDEIGGSAEQPQDGMASTINCAGQKSNDGGATFNNQLQVRQPNGGDSSWRGSQADRADQMGVTAAWQRPNEERRLGVNCDALNAPAKD
jgi:hypothetical protein